MEHKLEICSDTVESSLTAQASGADRIELCDNLPEGGTTPAYGTIAAARENLRIRLNILIRPRSGDFLYSDLEYEIMKKDILLCREAGADGIVTGILREDGTIDTERTAGLVRLAYPMEVTFHRAFDMCRDPFGSLEDIIAAGCTRLLTSGQENTAYEGAGRITELIEKAGSRIIIMPGSGINEENIEFIARTTRAREYHMSARKRTGSRMIFRKDGISMGGVAGYDEYSRKIADGEKIRMIKEILLNIQDDSSISG
jgi:copper homeostasis protein